MPSPQFALKRKTSDPGVTNVRNTASPHWRRWLGPSSRCLVPFTSFSEYETGADGKKVPVWFALDDSRPLAAFAGIWTNWTSVRKAKEGEVTADLYAFLTTEPNSVVAPIHPKAMPVTGPVRNVGIADTEDAHADNVGAVGGLNVVVGATNENHLGAMRSAGGRVREGQVVGLVLGHAATFADGKGRKEGKVREAFLPHRSGQWRTGFVLALPGGVVHGWVPNTLRTDVSCPQRPRLQQREGERT
jgi:hypothetical protein